MNTVIMKLPVYRCDCGLEFICVGEAPFCIRCGTILIDAKPVRFEDTEVPLPEGYRSVS